MRLDWFEFVLTLILGLTIRVRLLLAIRADNRVVELLLFLSTKGNHHCSSGYTKPSRWISRRFCAVCRRSPCWLHCSFSNSERYLPLLPSSSSSAYIQLETLQRSRVLVYFQNPSSKQHSIIVIVLIITTYKTVVKK